MIRKPGLCRFFNHAKEGGRHAGRLECRVRATPDAQRAPRTLRASEALSAARREGQEGTDNRPSPAQHAAFATFAKPRRRPPATPAASPRASRSSSRGRPTEQRPPEEQKPASQRHLRGRRCARRRWEHPPRGILRQGWRFGRWRPHQPGRPGRASSTNE